MDKREEIRAKAEELKGLFHKSNEIHTSLNKFADLMPDLIDLIVETVNG